MVTAQGCLGPPAARGGRKDLPQEPLEGVGLCPHLTADFWFQTQRIDFRHLKLPRVWLLVTAAPWHSYVSTANGTKIIRMETGGSFLSLRGSLFGGAGLSSGHCRAAHCAGQGRGVEDPTSLASGT